MNAPISREQWIDQRTMQLLEDAMLPDIVDDIQAHGGMAQQALASHLANLVGAETVFMREAARDSMERLIGAFALKRAASEYDHKPLVQG